MPEHITAEPLSSKSIAHGGMGDTPEPPALQLCRDTKGERLLLRGDCIALTVKDIPAVFRKALRNAHAPLCLDISGLGRLDASGARILLNMVQDMNAKGHALTLEGVRHEHAELLARLQAQPVRAAHRPGSGTRLLLALDKQGEQMLHTLREARDFLGFWGMMLARLASCVRHPGRLRRVSIVAQMDQTGVRAIPIVALLTFLIGMVVAYMAAGQLARFGANVYIVDLVVISCMRELGVLIMAIIVAGRSGSAFTAQIGSMQANEEIAAMRTMGMNPLDVLVLPRVCAMLIAMPLLTVVADAASIFGGMLAAAFSLDISFEAFWGRMYAILNLRHFFAGLVKAPFFALLISAIGCFEGFKVTGSAESVGQMTTRSVVLAIFLVILADAAFALLFMSLRF